MAKPNMVTLLNRNLRNKRAPQRKYFRMKNLTNILRKGVKKKLGKSSQADRLGFSVFFYAFPYDNSTTTENLRNVGTLRDSAFPRSEAE